MLAHVSSPASATVRSAGANPSALARTLTLASSASSPPTSKRPSALVITVVIPSSSTVAPATPLPMMSLGSV